MKVLDFFFFLLEFLMTKFGSGNRGSYQLGYKKNVAIKAERKNNEEMRQFSLSVQAGDLGNQSFIS